MFSLKRNETVTVYVQINPKDIMLHKRSQAPRTSDVRFLCIASCRNQMQRQEVQVCYQGWGWELSEWDGGSVVVTDISEAGCMATGVHQENAAH